MSGTSEGVTPVINMGEVHHCTMVVDSGKSNINLIPIGTPTIGAYLEDIVNAAKGRGVFQRYGVVGGDLEVVQLHHKQQPLIFHYST